MLSQARTAGRNEAKFSTYDEEPVRANASIVVVACAAPENALAEACTAWRPARYLAVALTAPTPS